MKVAAIMEAVHHHQAHGHRRHIQKVEVVVAEVVLTVGHLTAAPPPLLVRFQYS